MAPNALCATHSSPTSALLDALCYMTIELTFEKSVLHTAHLAPKVCCIVILHSVRVCMHNTVCCVCMHNTLCDMTIELTFEKSCTYGVATISRFLKIVGLFGRMSSLL